MTTQLTISRASGFVRVLGHSEHGLRNTALRATEKRLTADWVRKLSPDRRARTASAAFLAFLVR